jgi:HD-GYP domain-containing protein (c-di-GMP phosphodiesterase class II)
MTTDRPYRAALPLAEALEELRAHRTTQFDPGVVDALLAVHTDQREPLEQSAVAGARVEA